MMIRSRRVFLDTSVIFVAVLSESGGARLLFRLGEAGVLQLILGPNVLRRNVPASLPLLAYLLELGMVEIAARSPDDFIEQANTMVSYEPDVYVLAEAIGAEPDWFITHDKTHFLNPDPGTSVVFRIGTPGDLLQALEDEFSQA